MEPILKINSVNLSQQVLEHQVQDERDGAHIKRTMQVICRPDVEALRYVDLRGKVKLGVHYEGKQEPIFGGFINFAFPEGSTYELQATDPSQLVEEAKAGGCFGRGMWPGEIIYYLVKEIGSEGVDPKNFLIRDGQTLADTSLVSRQRRFIYIAPLPSCVLQAGTGTLKMVNSWIYTVADNNSADDRIIAEAARQEALWQECQTRVRFYVQAQDFLEALEKGHLRLQRLLDILSLGANYASATYPSPTGLQLFTYNRNRTLVDIERTEWTFLRDTGGEDRFWLHWSAPHRDRKPFSLDRDDPILALYAIFQDLAEADEEDLTGKDRALLNALHALHQVRQALDAKDALDHVWRCMEFLLAGYSTEPLFLEAERKAILRAAKTAIDDLVPDPRREAQMKRVENILSQQLNQTALRTTWKLFCADHALHFPKEDEDFLWKLRRNRNDHQHGRGTEVSRPDIERAATIMEKVLVAAVATRLERASLL